MNSSEAPATPAIYHRWPSFASIPRQTLFLNRPVETEWFQLSAQFGTKRLAEASKRLPL
jgi:hypothetical protein